MDRILALLVIGTLLTSCTPSNGDAADVKNDRYINTLYNYSLDVPHDIISASPSQTGSSIGFINYDHWQKNPPKNGYYLFIKTDSSCPPLGVSNTNRIKDDLWGKADYFDIYYTRDFPNMEEPFCRPLSPGPGVSRKHVDCEETDYESYECGVKNRQYEIDRGMYSAYAFCAEKDGKAVAICIQQMTDDEAMAKEIFESFRWTE